MARLDWLVARPIAHRGLHDAAAGIVENTAGAFERAIAGNYAIECDLQLTGDGEAVVFHDDTVDRLMDASGTLRACAAGDLKTYAFRACGDRIQTLAELLEQVDGRVPLVIELKSHWDGDETLAARALEVLSGYRGTYGVMSFDPDVVETVRRRSPETPRGMVADDAKGYGWLPPERRRELQTMSYLERTRPDFLSFQWQALPLPQVAEFRRSGHPVITWTIRDRRSAERALRHSDQITFEGFLA